MQDYIQVLAYRERIPVKRVRKLGVALWHEPRRVLQINIRAVASSLHIKLCLLGFMSKTLHALSLQSMIWYNCI
jgi:hypothetical protein